MGVNPGARQTFWAAKPRSQQAGPSWTRGSGRFEAAKDAQAGAEQAREAAERTLSEAQAARQSAQAAKAEAERRLERAGAESRRADEARQSGLRRVENAEATLALAREQAAKADAALALEAVETAGADETSAAEAEEFARLGAARDEAQNALTAVRIALATVSEKTGSLDRALRQARGEWDSLGASEERRVRQAAAAGEELAALVAQAAVREQEVVEAQAARQAAQAALEAQAGARQALQQDSYAANSAMRTLAEARAMSLDAVHKLELREARLSVQRDTLAARLWDEYEISLEAALALEEDPDVADGMPQEVARLRRELRVLGRCESRRH